jgi:hypothetical protein
MRWLNKLKCFFLGHDNYRVMVRSSVMKNEELGYTICRRCQHTKVIK